MKIIDAHLHYSDFPGFDSCAAEAGHLNSAGHLSEVFREHEIVCAVAMGAGHNEPESGLCLPLLPNLDPTGRMPGIAYCAGVESRALTPENAAGTREAFARLLAEDSRCVGLKFYCGYNYYYISDPRHDLFFELAREFDVPIVMHSGDTAGTGGLLKYAHPLTADEAAMRFPDVRIVLAHCGNPWIVDAVAVAAKNPNVFLDLSGLAVGNFEPEAFRKRYHGYLEHLRTWLDYLSSYDKVMYGSDWPLTNIGSYLELIGSLIPEEHHRAVFCENALRIFPRLQQLTGMELK